jgi:hypothetical protein
VMESNSIINSNYTIASGNNAFSAGPVMISTGIVVTVPAGSAWKII